MLYSLLEKEIKVVPKWQTPSNRGAQSRASEMEWQVAEEKERFQAATRLGIFFENF